MGYLAIAFRITNVYICKYSDDSSRCISYRSTLYSETFKMTVLKMFIVSLCIKQIIGNHLDLFG